MVYSKQGDQNDKYCFKREVYAKLPKAKSRTVHILTAFKCQCYLYLAYITIKDGLALKIKPLHIHLYFIGSTY